MIIGTAGHIDHGKTTLVRALTGIDTDRLPQEKARGISIELGYAYMPLADGQVLGFVDVPGHERFVHTMLSGATGIDLALLVVAADDGVMPQTREHLNILALLGVELGAIALTKIDATEARRLAAAEHEVRDLLASLCLSQPPIFPVCGRTAEGVEALRQYLVARAMGHVRQERDEHFRLAIDRSFSLPGVGTVVTGMAHSGCVRVGDQLRLVPGELQVRVRSIHAQDRAAELGKAGQRCALNLVGVGHKEVRRGHWIVAPPIAQATQRFDGELCLLAQEPESLTSGTRVHVHVGATHLPGHVVVLDSDFRSASSASRLSPGNRGLVQLVLQGPIGAWHGDRFILRDVSAKRTMGGGQILDPFAPARYRGTPQRLTALAALKSASPSLRLSAAIECCEQGVDLVRFAQAGKLRDLAPLLGSLAIRRIQRSGLDIAVPIERWRTLQQGAVDALAAFHAAHPDELGLDLARLRRMAFGRWDLAIVQALIGELVDAGKIHQTGAWVHLADHQREPAAGERALSEKLLMHILGGRFNPPWVRDLARELAQSESVVRQTLLRASRRGDVFQIVRDLFYHPIAVQELTDIVNELQWSRGEVSAASFRDRTGLGRKRAIQILEFFDRIGFTRRLHDRHLVRAESGFAPPGTDTNSASKGKMPAAHGH